MSIAIIIVNYTTGALVLEHLPQVRRELASVPGSHLFIVDNASPNGDAARLADGTSGFDDVTLIAAPRNGGFSYGNNLGFVRACEDLDPDYFYLLNPDAYPQDGALRQLVGFMAEHPRAGVVGTRLEGEDGEPQRSAFRYPSIASEFEGTARTGPISRALARHKVARVPSNHPHRTDWVSGASLFMRRDVYDRVGPMDEGYFLYFEELDYQHAVAAEGFEVWYLPEAVAVHLVGQATDMKDNQSRQGRIPDYWFDSRRRYFKKNHGAGTAALADLAYGLGKSVWGARGLVEGKGLRGVSHDIAGVVKAGQRAR